mgnify:FL=1
MPGTMISRGNILYAWLISPTLTPVAVAGSTTAEQSFTVGGLVIGDFVEMYSNAAQTAGLSIGNVRVASANTLTVQFSNSTAGSLTPVAGVYRCLVTRAESVSDLVASAA